MVDDYKARYYLLLKKLEYLHSRMSCDRCPVFKQCCAGCNMLDELVKKEKKDAKGNEPGFGGV